MRIGELVALSLGDVCGDVGLLLRVVRGRVATASLRRLSDVGALGGGAVLGLLGGVLSLALGALGLVAELAGLVDLFS